MKPTRREDLPPPPDDLRNCTDADRKIGGGAVYDLGQVKQYAKTQGKDVFNFATEKAEQDLRRELDWSLDDLLGFLDALDRRHYRGSEWCYGSGKASVAYPADVYVMGYSRFKRQEWPQQNPWNYLKFSFSEKFGTLEIFSIHPSDV